MHGWLQCSLDPTQKLLGTQHCSATGGGVRSDRLQQQRQELADHAVAAQHGFGRLPILGWPSRVTDDCYCLLDPLARYMLEDLAPQHLIRPRGVEHQHAKVTQQERCGIQITDRAQSPLSFLALPHARAAWSAAYPGP